MKKLLAISIIILGQTISGWAQTIDNKNYYQFQKHSGSINWLRTCDAVPIVIDELLKNGIPYHTIEVGSLIHLNDSTRFVVTVSFEKDNKEYGFLYDATHGIPLSPSDRDFLTDKTQSYVQAEKDSKGDVSFMRIDPLPKNIFLLNETCYWYQYGNEGTKYPISKDISENILRQDIEDYLKKL